MSLTDYSRKRSFDRTREPAPGKAMPKGKRAIFVVQLHHASRRHYDFRLQVGDALKSWAVPKGPSYDPNVKRMAVEVEDHPIDYATFEGEIPKGEYGGGHVAQFDHGVWSTDGDPEAQLAKGHLRFELFGTKLKGGWHLVRSGKPAKQPQWLLFKDKDRYVSNLEADDLLGDVSAPPAEDLKRAGSGKTVKKDLTAVAVAKKPTRKNWSKEALRLTNAKQETLGSEVFEPQLAKLGESAPTGENWLHEIKWDGYRILTKVINGKALLWSRNGIVWNEKIPEIASTLEALGLRSATLDGELVSGAGTKEDFNLLVSTLKGEKQGNLAYVLFDLLHIDGVDISNAPLLERKALLEQVLKNPPPHLAYSSHSVGHGAEAYKMASEQHFEGIISKRIDRSYHSGRSDDWRKTKNLQSDEFAVIGFTAPKGSRQGFGSLLLARPDKKHGWLYAGKVGSGFSDELMRVVTKKLKKDGSKTPTAHVPENDTDLRSALWFEPDLVVEVFYRGIGTHGLLRQPSLKGMRPDKSPKDLEDSDRSPTENSKSETQSAKRATKPTETSVRLTSPTRVVYPDNGITKQQVAEYYATMSEWLLPEISNRPVSIIRCTQGVGRPCFFQKHHTAGLEHVDSVKLKEEAGSQADYLVVNDEQALMELVQFNALEFHPWGARATKPDYADRIVFDLDPGPGVPWAEVVEAAIKIKALLEQVELVSFVRTSGGKGLHVVVPLNPGCKWTLAKPFAKGFADVMSAMEPLKFLATATKKFRNNKIFLDYLRNGRGATSVASFSLRARDGAPVAMPLKWAELKNIKSGAAFDIKSAVSRMKKLKAHPWQGIDDIHQDLEQVGVLLNQGSSKPSPLKKSARRSK